MLFERREVAPHDISGRGRLPPGVLMRTTTARTHGSHSIASSRSRNAETGFSPHEPRPVASLLSNRPSTSTIAILGAFGSCGRCGNPIADTGSNRGVGASWAFTLPVASTFDVADRVDGRTRIDVERCAQLTHVIRHTIRPIRLTNRRSCADSNQFENGGRAMERDLRISPDTTAQQEDR